MKSAQVIWSDAALNDLEIIYDFLAEQSQPTAQRIIESILNRTKQLESFPESGAKQKFEVKEYRYLVEGNYKIIYRYQLENQSIYVVTIFDTRYGPERIKL